MLTFSSLGYTSALTGGTFREAKLEYRFGQSFCTNFEHDPSQSTFTGKARLSGEAWGAFFADGTAASEVSFGTVPDLTVTVVDSTYDAANGTGSCAMTGTFDVQTFWAPYGFLSAATEVTLALSWNTFEQSGSNVEGSCDAEYATLPSGNSYVTNAAPFSLVRLGTCLV